MLGRKLLALDFTFAERFASFDNPAWLIFLAAITFTLFEPMQAAAATLLLVDGRVRQEGLDLLAAVQQLPARGRTRGAQNAALVFLCLLLGGTAARAQAPEKRGVTFAASPAPGVGGGAVRVRSAEDLKEGLDAADSLSAAEEAKLQRLLRTVEGLANDKEDCEAATETLQQGLALAQETAALEQATPDARTASARARDILSRPEFSETPAPSPEKGSRTRPCPPSRPVGGSASRTGWESS